MSILTNFHSTFKLNCATISTVINNITMGKSRDDINVKIIEEYIKVNNQSNQIVEMSIVQSTVSKNYFPIDEGKDNPCHHSLFAKDSATTLIENIRSNFEKIDLSNKLSEQALIKDITNINVINDSIKENDPSTTKVDIIKE